MVLKDFGNIILLHQLFGGFNLLKLVNLKPQRGDVEVQTSMCIELLIITFLLEIFSSGKTFMYHNVFF